MNGAKVSHRRGEHVRQTVLMGTAAFDEIVEHGGAGATIASVAARSGVHETTIYRRWVTRERLLVDALLNRSADVVPVPDTGSTRDDLLMIVSDIARHLTTPVWPGDSATVHDSRRRDQCRSATGILGWTRTAAPAGTPARRATRRTARRRRPAAGARNAGCTATHADPRDADLSVTRAHTDSSRG